MKMCQSAMAVLCWLVTLIMATALAIGDWPANQEGGKTQVSSSRVVNTRKGSLRGLYQAFDDKQLAAVELFLGVPYASPPLGSLRFMPPVTVSPWRGIRQADRYGPVCPQKFPDITNETEVLKRMPRGRLETLKKLAPMLTNQSEDCLYLNIFTPYSNAFAASPTALKPRYPVIVFIHGESYSWGSGNPYDGSVLAAVGKVVVVTLNYRLGVLGFLNPHSDPYSRSISNHGLMDQIAALHWLQENVQEFGGDPNSVTLMGHGTGAACATFLMTSPAVLDGLFQRAILLSGTALSPWALVQEPNKYAVELVRHMNCSLPPGEGATAQLKCLREKAVPALISAGSRVETPEFLHSFGPSVDGVVIEDEYEANKKKLSHRLSRYDLLFGVTQAESYFTLSADDNQYGMELDRRNRLLRTFVRNTYQFHLQEILATIINEYTDWEKTILHPVNIRDETLEALGDAQYVAPLVKTADLHSSQQRSSYFYVFEYQTKSSDFPQRPGCVHGEELAYIFGAPLVASLSHFGRNYTKAEVSLSEAVIAYWSNFARGGNPNEGAGSIASGTIAAEAGKQDKSRSRVEWPPYDQTHRRYLSLGLKPKAKSHYRSHKLAMWMNLIPDLHRPSGEDVARVHHLLDDYNDPYSYDGKVRVVPATLAPTPTSTTSPSPITSAVNSSLLMVDSSRKADSGGAKYGEPEASSKLTNDSRMSTGTGGNAGSVRANEGSNTEQYGAYSTALSVTIAIGCSLLILNVLIFAGVYYQRDKQRMELKRRLENGMILSTSVSGEVENHASTMVSSTRLCSKPDLANGAALNKTDSSSGSGRNTAAVVVINPSSSVMSLSSPFNSSVTQLPPPEFADFPSEDQCPAAMGTAATGCPSGGNSNGRASMISNSTVSFRPVGADAPSSTSTLPRMSTTGFCNNEYTLPPVTSLQQSQQQQQQRSMSLRKQSNKRIASPVGNSAIDELRV